MMNVINGGKHADNSVNLQEFMIMPVGATSFREAFRWCTEVFHTLSKLLKAEGYSTAVGDEGGFAPNLKSDEEALQWLVKAIEEAGYTPAEDFFIAMDPASTELYEEAKKIGKDGYYFWKTDEFKTTEEMIDYYAMLADKYPIISLEDGLAEDDWEGWQELNARIGDKVQLVGDDLYVTNTERLEKGIELNASNSILLLRWHNVKAGPRSFHTVPARLKMSASLTSLWEQMQVRSRQVHLHALTAWPNITSSYVLKKS